MSMKFNSSLSFQFISVAFLWLRPGDTKTLFQDVASFFYKDKLTPVHGYFPNVQKHVATV